MGRLTIPALVFVLALLWPSTIEAQSSNGSSIDPTKLGVSIERIKRELHEAETETRTDSGLKISFRIEVYGEAPPIDIIGDFNVLTGPVPGSPPTHRDHIEHVTPREYRAPAASLSNVFFWAAQKLSEKSAKQRCEEELAQYRIQVMSGINVAAPTLRSVAVRDWCLAPFPPAANWCQVPFSGPTRKGV
jgi:hypothetical protein